MPLRPRKLIGTVLLFVLVIVWALLGMVLAQALLVDRNLWIATAYYVIVGMGWVLPAMLLVRWMYRGALRR